MRMSNICKWSKDTWWCTNKNIKRGFGGILGRKCRYAYHEDRCPHFETKYKPAPKVKPGVKP